jgi:hypothetical protein
MGLLLRNIRVPRGLIFAAELGLETGSRKKEPPRRNARDSREHLERRRAFGFPVANHPSLSRQFELFPMPAGAHGFNHFTFGDCQALR